MPSPGKLLERDACENPPHSMSGTEPRSPHLSAEQLKASRQKFPPVPAVCVVTGGTGFVGSRLVEMLVERGATKVRVLDVVPPGPLCWKDPRIEYHVGSICDAELVAKVVDGADCVWHMAAAVGPFHPKKLYRQVNYEGTMTVVAACRAKGVHKIVMSSSPSTRFDGSDVDGLTEAQMPTLPQKSYLQIYAATKVNPNPNPNPNPSPNPNPNPNPNPRRRRRSRAWRRASLRS